MLPAMTHIAIVGPGAIGGTVAVRLTATPHHRIIVCARSPLARLTVETDNDATTIEPEVHTTPDTVQPADWVLIATKVYDAAAAGRWLHRLAGPETRVAVLQNGVEHVERFAPFVPEARIVPVIVDMPVERTQPGVFRQRREGRLTVAAGADGEDFARLFTDPAIQVQTTADFHSEAWRKLALNCAGAVPALILKPAGIAHNRHAAEVMQALIREAIAVGRAEGAHLDEALVDSILDQYRNGPPDAINSLHADRLGGRRLEIDARNGAVVRIGRRHGIATPVNQAVAALLEAASSPSSSSP
jgi:2-dehydropantoate 2-reductase